MGLKIFNDRSHIIMLYTMLYLYIIKTLLVVLFLSRNSNFDSNQQKVMIRRVDIREIIEAVTVK